MFILKHDANCTRFTFKYANEVFTSCSPPYQSLCDSNDSLLSSSLPFPLLLAFFFLCLCMELPFSHGCTAMLRLPLVVATVAHQYPTFLPLLSKNPPNHSGHILHGIVKSNDFFVITLFFIFYIYFSYLLFFLRAEKQNGVKIKIKWKLKLKEK